MKKALRGAFFCWSVGSEARIRSFGVVRMSELMIVGLLGLVWGSFLNVVGYRLMSGDSLLGARSRCPRCAAIIRWYDLFPVVSYCALGGVARCCRIPISWLYPFIEIFSAVAALALWHDALMWSGYGSLAMIGRMSAYGILLSGFIVATRTDLEALVVPRIVIAVMGVAGGLASVCGVLPVSVLASCLGAGVGYLSLWGLNYLSRRMVGQDGIGEGDMELLAVVGIFWGLVGVWAVAFMSSVLGTLCALVYLAMTGKGRHTRIPFIPFMAVSVVAFLFLQNHIINWLWSV